MRSFPTSLLVLLFIVIVLRIDFFFTVVYFLVAIYLLSRQWSQRSSTQVRVERRFVPRAFIGDRVPVEVTVRNAGWLPVPWLEVSESIPLPLLSERLPGQVLSLGVHEQRRLTYTLRCRRRGYYALGPMTLETGDLLGVDRRVRKCEEGEHLTVYPRIVPLAELGIPTRSALVALPAASPLFEDPSRIMGVRDYRRGDSPRRIHWSSSARVGKLVVKRYQPAIARETLICLDLDEEHYGTPRRDESIELAIVAAASIANHIIVVEGLPVGLATEAWDPRVDERRRVSLPPRAERSQLVQILEVLGRVQAAQAGSFVELLRRESVHLSWGSTMVVITAYESDELADTMVYLKRTGFAVILVVVDRLAVAPDAASNVVGLPVHRIRSEPDLAATLASR